MIELWNVSRAMGLVALLLMGVVLALGALHNTSLTKLLGQALPRFVLVALHRNLALITVVFVALHVVTVLVTPYLPLRWYHVFVPFTATFNPWPVALGAIALDLLLAVVISSTLRRYFTKRAWLLVHWSIYVSFPVAVAHAVVNASFRGGTWWTLVVPLAASALVVGALLYRRAARRTPALPLADRGRTDPAEARKAADHATGSQPVVRVDEVPESPGAPAPRVGETGAPVPTPSPSSASPASASPGGTNGALAASEAASAPFVPTGDGVSAGDAPGEGAPGRGTPAEGTPSRRGGLRELRVVARPANRSAVDRPRRSRHSADPEDDAGADAQTDTMAGTEAPTVALPPRPRRR